MLGDGMGMETSDSILQSSSGHAARHAAPSRHCQLLLSRPLSFTVHADRALLGTGVAVVR